MGKFSQIFLKESLDRDIPASGDVHKISVDRQEDKLLRHHIHSSKTIHDQKTTIHATVHHKDGSHKKQYLSVHSDHDKGESHLKDSSGKHVTTVKHSDVGNW